MMPRLIERLLPWSHHTTVRQFYKFGIVGVTNTLIDFSIYLALTRLTTLFAQELIAANVISFSVAVTNSFVWNRRWTFRSSEKERVRQYVKFVFINCIGLILNSGLLYIFTFYVGFHDLISKILAVAITLFWNFFMNRWWVFNPKSLA